MLLIRNTNLFNEIDKLDFKCSIGIIHRHMFVPHLLTGAKHKKKSVTFYNFDTPVIKVMPELKNKSKKTEKLMGVLRCTKEKLEAIENKAKSENITVTELFNRALDKYCDLD